MDGGYDWVVFNGAPLSTNPLGAWVDQTVPLAISNTGETVGYVQTETPDIIIPGAHGRALLASFICLTANTSLWVDRMGPGRCTARAMHP